MISRSLAEPPCPTVLWLLNIRVILIAILQRCKDGLITMPCAGAGRWRLLASRPGFLYLLIFIVLLKISLLMRNHLITQTQTLSGRLLPRLLPLTLFFLAGATWLLQKPPGTIVLVVEKAGAIKPAAKFQGSFQKQMSVSVIPHPKQRQLPLASTGKDAPATDSQWVNQTLPTSYKNRTSIYLYSAYFVSSSLYEPGDKDL